LFLEILEKTRRRRRKATVRRKEMRLFDRRDYCNCPRALQCQLNSYHSRWLMRLDSKDERRRTVREEDSLES
jgi:hypothetical protein